MRKKIYSKFDKKEITALPLVVFTGRIISIISPKETDKAVDYLLAADILGVDTETKPAFHRGEQHQVCLLQVSTRDTCFLFRLNHTGITPAIKRLLEDTTVKKIGLSWHDDLRALKARESFTPGLFIDLQDVVSAIQLSRETLGKIKQNLFFSLFYNVIGIPIAARVFIGLGIVLRPELAGLAMALSSVSVVSNSLLLRRFHPGRRNWISAFAPVVMTGAFTIAFILLARVSVMATG